jgi:cell division septal protein FtsQ
LVRPLLLQFSPQRLLRPLAISTSVAILTASAALIVSYLLFPVTGVEVEGARMFPQSEAWKAVPNHASLLFLNTNNLARQIESNPWVKSVEVLKDWESGIVTIKVEEREAVLDGDLGGRQIVLSADGMELPSLGGAGLERIELDEVQLEEILMVSEVLEENELVLASVDRVDAGGIEATVEGRPVLFGGKVGNRQARALKGLVADHPDAPYFDLRSPERVVIGAEPRTETGG